MLESLILTIGKLEGPFKYLLLLLYEQQFKETIINLFAIYVILCFILRIKR